MIFIVDFAIINNVNNVYKLNENSYLCISVLKYASIENMTTKQIEDKPLSKVVQGASGIVSFCFGIPFFLFAILNQ